jgi:predicted nucleic acid-binding protein
LKAIADTGFIVAFVNRNDQYHTWATAFAGHIDEPLLTCEAVLAEAVFQLSSASIVLGLLQDGLLRLSFQLQENIDQVEELAVRYHDRQPDLADLCLVRMSELYPRHTIVTVDMDFRYRRNRREAIPLICPRNKI